MDTKPPAPSGNDPELNKRPLGTTPNSMNTTTPTPLGNFDFDREIDEPPTHPGPLLQQKPGPTSKKGGGAKTFIMVLLTILLLAAIAAAGYFYWQNTQLQDQVTQKDSQVATLTTDNAKLKSDAEKVKDEEPVKTLTQTEQAGLTASEYACKVVLTGMNTCDKATEKVTKIQEFKVTPATQGFAIVHISDVSKKVLMKLLLKSHDGVSWSVIYDGEAVPAEVTKKFVVPADFANLAQ